MTTYRVTLPDGRESAPASSKVEAKRRAREEFGRRRLPTGYEVRCLDGGPVRVEYTPPYRIEPPNGGWQLWRVIDSVGNCRAAVQSETRARQLAERYQREAA